MLTHSTVNPWAWGWDKRKADKKMRVNHRRGLRKGSRFRGKTKSPASSNNL